jgi:hypothetical protein
MMIGPGAIKMERIFQATVNNIMLENLRNDTDCGYNMFKMLHALAIAPSSGGGSASSCTPLSPPRSA